MQRRWGDNVALDGVTLAIRQGELVLLAGPSGSGKTTLLRMLAGVLRPSSGQVEIEGVDLMSLAARGLRRHGYALFRLVLKRDFRYGEFVAPPSGPESSEEGSIDRDR